MIKNYIYTFFNVPTKRLATHGWLVVRKRTMTMHPCSPDLGVPYAIFSHFHRLQCQDLMNCLWANSGCNTAIFSFRNYPGIAGIE